MTLTPEKAGWSGAPDVVEELARQKAECDKTMALIRSGRYSVDYSMCFGLIESIWRYVYAVGIRGGMKEEYDKAALQRTKLWQDILEYDQLDGCSEALPILEEQRLRKLHALRGKIVNEFDEFYQQVLLLGVRANLFSYQKGGDFQPGKNQRIAGVPTL